MHLLFNIGLNYRGLVFRINSGTSLQFEVKIPNFKVG